MSWLPGDPSIGSGVSGLGVGRDMTVPVGSLEDILPPQLELLNEFSQWSQFLLFYERELVHEVDEVFEAGVQVVF